MRETELLIPAGGLDVLKTAVIFGADAVCIGGEAFGLRAKARNFSRSDTKEGIASVHARRVRVYMTANVLAHSGDLPGMGAYFKELKGISPDTLIVPDPDVFVVARKVLPGMEIHISAQANNTNYGAYLFWHKLGTRRMVAARGLSLDEVWEVREHTPENMEIESFIHGAMRISYSGHRLLSNLLVGRDANQGTCTHPCRWKYSIVEKTKPDEYMLVYKNERGTYIFNSKDPYMIGHTPGMMDAGVGSSKMESRMRTALYMATVVRTYKKVIDGYKKDPQLYRDRMEWYRQEVGRCTYRGFTMRFYFGKSTEGAQIHDNNTYMKNYVYLGAVLEVDGRGRCLVQQKSKSCVGDTIEAMKPDGRNLELTVASMKDEGDDAQDSASYPKRALWISLGVDADLKVYDILRKEEESA